MENTQKKASRYKKLSIAALACMTGFVGGVMFSNKKPLIAAACGNGVAIAGITTIALAKKYRDLKNAEKKDEIE